MAHYAEIKDGLVARVIVVDDDQAEEIIKSFGGKWVKTSFNTRDGVHYGQDGKPDGEKALRLNYAQPGFVYDEKNDIFYQKNQAAETGDLFYLDKRTMIYKLPLPNKAVTTPLIAGAETKKIFITAYGSHALGAQAIQNLTESLGIGFVFDPSKADIAMPMNNLEAYGMALRPEFDSIRPINMQAWLNISDRKRQHTLNLPSLACYELLSAEAFLASAPKKEAVFVKRQRCIRKDTGPLAYTKWDSPQAFVDHIKLNVPDFWEQQKQNNEEFGQYIAQPFIQTPFKDLDIYFSVNNKSQVHIFNVQQSEHQADTALGSWTPYRKALPEELISAIKADALALNLKAGIHNVQMAPYKDTWVLLDWKPLVTDCYQKVFPSVYPVLDDALSWMLDLPLREEAKYLHMEQRSYQSYNLGREAAFTVGECGLFARWKNDKLDRVAGIGVSQREISDRYAQLDQNLVLIPK